MNHSFWIMLMIVFWLVAMTLTYTRDLLSLTIDFSVPSDENTQWYKTAMNITIVSAMGVSYVMAAGYLVIVLFNL